MVVDDHAAVREGVKIMLVYSEQGAAVQDPHQVAESGGGVFVDHGVGAEQLAVPGAADGDVAHGQRDVVECRKCHDYVFLSGQCAPADERRGDLSVT